MTQAKPFIATLAAICVGAVRKMHELVGERNPLLVRRGGRDINKMPRSHL